MKLWILTLLVYIAALIPVAALGFFLAIFLVGPHGGILPNILRIPVGIMLWISVICIPLWIAYKMYIKFKKNTLLHG